LRVANDFLVRTDIQKWMSVPQPLRVLMFQDLPGHWAARCLEHNVTVEGRSFEIVLERILQVIFAHIDFDRRHGRKPLSTFPASPRHYFDAFPKARPVHRVTRSTDPQQVFGVVLVSVSDHRPMPARSVPAVWA
jgi:hypothetical protein